VSLVVRMPEENNVKYLRSSLECITSLVILSFFPSILLATEINPVVIAMVNNVAINDAELLVLTEARSRHSMEQVSSDGSLSKAQKQKLIDDLVLAEILVQEAGKTGLDKLSRTVAEAAIQYKTLIGQMFLRQEIAKMQVSEEEIRQRYDAIPTKYKYGLRVINATTQEAVNEILEVLSTGTEFKTVSDSYVIMEEDKNGGWLGWLRSSQINPQHLEVVRNLKVATFTTTPLKTKTGWRFIYLEGKKELDKTPYDRSRDWLRDEIQQIRVQTLLAELRQNADVKFFNHN